MTQLESARRGVVTDAMRRVAKAESVSVESLRDAVAAGHVAIPCNSKRKASELTGIGKGLRTKVNANIGTSKDYPNLDAELDKLRAAVEAGTDSVMDLSTGGDIHAIRLALMERCEVTVGTVPIYDAAVTAAAGQGGIRSMTAESMLATVRQHGEDGVDFVTIHCGVTREVVRGFHKADRTCGIVSRGGTILADWITAHKQENPFYERFDEVLDIAREYDITLSLGDGMRPGSVADAFDQPQVHELIVLAELCARAQAAGIQVIVEGPGHVPLDQVAAQVQLQKALCQGAPFYVLGPIVTDVAPGYDHITSAIGGAVAAWAGADFLCYVTPSEHLGLPAADQVREGVVAARIAGHAADIAKGVKGALDWDRALSHMRRDRDWEGQLAKCIDPAKAARLRHAARPNDEEVCSMCGEFCVFKLTDQAKLGAD